MRDATDVEAVVQAARLELYQDDLTGALATVEAAHQVFPDPRYRVLAARIRSWLAHLESREAYAAAYERYYRSVKRRRGLKWLEREWRTLTGRRARKIVARMARHPEFRLLEDEIRALGARRVLDAGCGEGRVAIALGARHPGLRVDAIEVSRTNMGIARRLSRSPGVVFHHGLIEEAESWLPRDGVDLAYAFAVLEHVRDVDETVTALLKLVRSGGRLCFVVPMIELRATGPLPDFSPEDPACHVRMFTDEGLGGRFGDRPGFALHPLPGKWRRGRYPAALVPVKIGSYFVAFSKP